MGKFTNVMFTDRPMKKPQGRSYSYHTPKFDVKVGDMVVVQSGSGYGVGQVVGTTDTILFDEKLAKHIVTKFETE
jgi:hypothetical protein